MAADSAPRSAAAGAILVVITLIGGCQGPPASERQLATPGNPVDVATAAAMIRTHLASAAQGTVPALEFVDLTSEDVLGRMGLQVFLEIHSGTSYVVRRGEVRELCEGFGGHGLQSMCVADLDGDGSLELVFSYSWGTGVHRSHIGVCVEEQGRLRIAVAPLRFYGDLFVVKQGEGRVAVVAGDYPDPLYGRRASLDRFTTAAVVGEVEVSSSAGATLCGVALSEGLSTDLAGAIDSYDR